MKRLQLYRLLAILEIEMKRLGPSILLVHLLFTFLRVEAMDDVRSQLRSPPIEGVGNLAELLWDNCRLEMTHLKEVYKDLDFGIFGPFGSNVLEGDNFQKLLNVLPRQLQPELFDCLKEKVLLSHFSRYDESSSGWYLKFTGTLISRHYGPAQLRRYLAGVFNEPSRKMAQSYPARTSKSSHSSSFTDDNLVRITLEAESRKQDNIQTTIIITIVVTTTFTFILTLLLFLCCYKYFGISFGNSCKDDNPHHSIHMSSCSHGSSKSTVFHSSSHKTSFQSFDNNFNDNEVVVFFEGHGESDVLNASPEKVGRSSSDLSNVDANVLSTPPKLSSGRVPPLSGLPPLKPPPRRTMSLPPEPPDALRSSSPSRMGPLPSLPSIPSALSPLGQPLSSSSTPRKPPSGGAEPSSLSPSQPPPPPPTSGNKPGVSPPPLPKFGLQPPGAPPGSGTKTNTNSSRTKLKPFFWDKILASPGHKMVWDQLKSGSFQFNEEMIESLFGYAPPDKDKVEQKKVSSSTDQPKLIELIDSKKAHNVSILLRALNVTTEEICDALEQGHELPAELLETLMKMAPTTDEELKLRLFSGDLSELRPAERFLKVMVDIPFFDKRMEALHFMCTLEDDVKAMRESFKTLEAACNELQNSRLFLKLLEAVLKTGNRMNAGTFRGGAEAFKLDTLLKLSDVKAVDGKATLLHFVVLEIIRLEGIRVAREARASSSDCNAKLDDLHEDSDDDSEEEMRSLGLQVVSGLSGQLENVQKAAGLDGETLSASVTKIGSSMVKAQNFLNKEMQNIDENNGFHRVLKCFVEEMSDMVTSLVDQEKIIAESIKNTADFFHGKPGKEEGLRLFCVVRDFLIILDKECKEIEKKFKKSNNNHTQSQKKDPPNEKHSLNEGSSKPAQ